MANSAAMELKVLISILQSGTALPQMLNQVNQLSQALSKLQNQAGGGPGGPPPSLIPPVVPPNATPQMMTLATAINNVTTALKFMAGGFLALQSVRFVKDLADTAARAEVLQTTLHVVARNAGILTEDIDKLDKSVQAMGITASSSRQSLVQMMQAKLDVAWAPKLARAAQDLAVVSGMNSSATFQRLILNIQQLDALGLRWMGIMVSREEAEQRYAAANNLTVKGLSRRQSVEAFMIETMRKLTDLEGAYAAAMGDVGKQLLSLERLTETLKQTLGDALLPVYSALVRELSLFWEELTVIAQVATKNKDGMVAMADAVSEWGKSIREWLIWALDHRELIIDIIQKVILLKAVVLAFRLINWIGTGALAFLQFLIGATKALQALRAGQIGYMGLLSVLEAKSIAAGKAQLQLAIAETAAARAAQGATVAQTGLQAGLARTTGFVGVLRMAWLGLASLMAVPIIGLVIARKQEEAATGALPFWRQVEEAKKPPKKIWDWEYWWEQITGAPDPITKQNRMQELFVKWQRDNADLVKQIEEKTGVKPSAITGAHSLLDGGAVAAQFLWEEKRQRAIKEQNVALQANFQIYDKIQEQRAKIAVFEDVIKKGVWEATEAELAAAEKQKADAQAELLRLQEMLQGRKSTEAELAEQRVLALLRERREVEIKIGKGEYVSEEAEKQALSDVSTRLKRAQEALTIALDTAPGKTPEQRAEERRKADIRIARIERDALEESVRKGSRELSGAKYDFSTGQRQMAAFAQGAKTVRDEFDLIEAVQEDIAKGGIDQMAHEERLKVLRAQQAQDLRSLAKTVTKASIADFREIVTEYVKTSGDAKTAREALASAEESARKEALEDNREIIERRKALISQRTEGGILGAKREQDTIKTLLREERLLVEESYANKLTTTDDYYGKRRRIITDEAKADLKVADAEINRLTLLRDAETEDVDARIQAGQKLTEAEDRRRAINQKLEGDLADLNREQRDRIRDLFKEITVGRKEFDASVGGMFAELAKLTYELDEQAKIYAQLGGEKGAEGLQLVALRRLAGQFEIVNKYRQQALDLEIQIENVVQGQLNLTRAIADETEATLAVRVAKGEVTTDEARRTREVAAVAEMARITSERESEERKLAAQRRTAEREARELPAQLLRQGVDPLVVLYKTYEAHIRNQQAIAGTETRIVNLKKAYADLGVTVRTYGEEISESFKNQFADALTTSITDFKNAGDAWISLSKSITNEIVSIFVEAFTQRLFRKNIFGWVDQLMNRLFGGGGAAALQKNPFGAIGTLGIGLGFAGGGPVSGPGTGTSDSIPALLSTGEHIMPADKAAQWMPLLEGIRTGKILPFVHGGVVQSIAMSPVIPRRYASGGVVVSDGGASAVQTGGGAANMVVSMHPDTLNMTMREWLEHEVVRQQGRR